MTVTFHVTVRCDLRDGGIAYRHFTREGGTAAELKRRARAACLADPWVKRAVPGTVWSTNAYGAH
jgi:hypothetical protein